MEMCHKLEKTENKFEDGTDFTQRLLDSGSGLQLMLMKTLVTNQLFTLMKSIPNPDQKFDMEFHTDQNVFLEAVNRTFGSFKKEDIKV